MIVIIQIGNSDDKLTQAQWANFYRRVDIAVQMRAKQVFFSGASYPAAEWQNAAFIFEIDENPSVRLFEDMKIFCELFHQYSIAWTEAKYTVFITTRAPSPAKKHSRRWPNGRN